MARKRNDIDSEIREGGPSGHLRGNTAAGWTSRFPPSAQPMATAPRTATKPIILFEPTGKYYYGIPYLDSWREVAPQIDADDKRRIRMTGNIIRNPVAWSKP